MKRFSITAGIMALVLLVSVLVGTSAVVLAQGPCPGHKGEGFWSNLTDEQRVAVQEKKKEMRSQDATREEIHSAVAEMLKGYGIEVPEDWHGPEGFGHGKAGFKANLTDEQREAIREKKEEMRSQGATREEIRSAKAEMLKAYGIEVPEDWHGSKGFGHGKAGFKANLTDEQRQTLREKIREMRSQDATREEIHSAVAEMLKGYGIELPEDCHGPIGFGHRKVGFKANLTEEQREAIREKVKEMRSQGATRGEIHDVVNEMLEGYGFESPEDSERTSSETASAELQIQAQSYPNPFNPQTEIAYSLPEDSYVKLTIYNVQGQKVTTLVDGYQSAGTRNVVWDGRDESGEGVASGVYLYRIEAGPHAVTNRMVLLK
jgi:DNA-binding transcriptional regulator YhcF (GntR family)